MGRSLSVPSIDRVQEQQRLFLLDHDICIGESSGTSYSSSRVKNTRGH